MSTNPVYDELLTKAEQAFDIEEQNEILRQFHELLSNLVYEHQAASLPD